MKIQIRYTALLASIFLCLTNVAVAGSTPSPVPKMPSFSLFVVCGLKSDLNQFQHRVEDINSQIAVKKDLAPDLRKVADDAQVALLMIDGKTPPHFSQGEITPNQLNIVISALRPVRLLWLRQRVNLLNSNSINISALQSSKKIVLQALTPICK